MSKSLRYAIVRRFTACLLCAAAAVASLAHASSVSGTMAVQLMLEPSCEFITGNMDAGLLDFGRTGGSQVLADATADPSRSLAMIRVACSSAYTGANAPVLTVSNGLHAIGAQRYLMEPGGERIAYDLYLDPARHLPLNATAPVQLLIPVAGVITAIPIYGRIPRIGDPVAGRYTDVVWLTLSY